MAEVQVTGTYLRADGSPDHGHIDFCLVQEAVDVAGDQRTGSVVRAPLDDTGSIDVLLVPDADLVGVDGDAVYAVSERIGGMHRDWWLHIPDDAESPIDLPSRHPGEPAGNVALLPLPGPEGPQGPPGADGSDGADGADAVWWSGTQAQYDAIPVKDPQTVYLIVG